MSYAGCVTLFKARQSRTVRFSFMPLVMKSPGLKPYRDPKRKEQLGVCSLPGFYAPQAVIPQPRTPRIVHSENPSNLTPDRIVELL
jgi:hypothetical protein